MKQNNKGAHLAASETKKSPAKKKLKASGKKKVLVTLGLIAAILLVVVLAVYFIFLHFYSAMNFQAREELSAAVSEEYVRAVESEFFYDGSDTEAQELSQEDAAALMDSLKANAETNLSLPNNENVYNILLLGNDTRGSGVGERTDAMVLVSINKDNKEITMTSFLRDIYVYIPGCGYNRLNAANVFGGPSLTLDTIEQNFGVAIDSYAEVNFFAFIDIIDILGGVDVELSNAEISEMNEKMQEVNWYTYYSDAYLYENNIYGGAGSYHLNGAQTLAYCRVRYADSDFGRTERQRIVLEQIWEKAKQMSITDATSILSQVLPQVTTNLSQADCLSLISSAPQMLSYETSALHIPADNTYSLAMINGMSVLSIDMESNAQLLQEQIYGE